MPDRPYPVTREDRVEEVLELWVSWPVTAPASGMLPPRVRQVWPELARRLDALADAWDES